MMHFEHSVCWSDSLSLVLFDLVYFEFFSFSVQYISKQTPLYLFWFLFFFFFCRCRVQRNFVSYFCFLFLDFSFAVEKQNPVLSLQSKLHSQNRSTYQSSVPSTPSYLFASSIHSHLFLISLFIDWPPRVIYSFISPLHPLSLPLQFPKSSHMGALQSYSLKCCYSSAFWYVCSNSSLCLLSVNSSERHYIL